MSLLTKVITTVFGSKSEKDLKQLKPFADEVNLIYPDLSLLSNEELIIKFSNHKNEIETIRDEAKARAKSEWMSLSESYNLIYRSEQDYLDKIMPEGISNISIPIALAATISPIINVVAAISSDAKPGSIGIIIPCATDNKKDGI